MSSTAIADAGAVSASGPTGWLRGPVFDLAFIGGVLLFALGLGALAMSSPVRFGWVLFFDLWLLAYPHVASTFGRVVFDGPGARAQRFLLVGLPPLVLFATAGVALAGGVALLNSVYYYWQTYHYTKQSYGIARAYGRASGGQPSRDWLSDAVIFAFPIWGVLHRAHQAQPLFYFSPLLGPAIPRSVELVAGALALTMLGAWVFRWWRDNQGTGMRGLGHPLYVLSHVIVTVVSYVAVRDVTEGWLVINIWHNAQYLLFVWAKNQRRGSSSSTSTSTSTRASVWWSRVCQRDRVLVYAAVLLGASSLFYLTLGLVTAHLAWAAFPLILVCHQAVNFHHYLVDSVIWRARAPARAVVS